MADRSGVKEGVGMRATDLARKDESCRPGSISQNRESAISPVNRGGHGLTNGDWSRIKRDFLTGKPARRISRILAEEGIKISHVVISRRAKDEGWRDLPDFKPFQHSTVAERVLDAISRGATPINAAAACDLTKEDFAAWLARDPGFKEKVDLARLAYLATREQKITEAGDRGDLRANLAILERAAETKEAWAPQARNQHKSGDVTVILNVGDPKPLAPPPINVNPW